MELSRATVAQHRQKAKTKPRRMPRAQQILGAAILGLILAIVLWVIR